MFQKIKKNITREGGKDYEQFSTTLPIKFLKLLRLHGFKAETKLSKILEQYQKAYLELLDFKKGKIQCSHCGSKIKSVEEIKGILCGECVNQ